MRALLTVGLILPLTGCGHPANRVVPGGDAKRGKQWLNTMGCGGCHQIDGVRNARGRIGPPLTAFSERTMIAGEVANTAENLVRWICNPQAIEPGTAMPNLHISEEIARDMAAFLYTRH
jgi:cytochrome c